MFEEVMKNHEDYELKLESMSFDIVKRKSDNDYFVVYGTKEQMEELANLLRK